MTPGMHAKALSGRLIAGVRALAGMALDSALPPLCPGCRELVADHGGLCAACWSRIPFAFDPGPGVLSLEAIADPPAYGRARAAVRYDDVARDLVHAFKYGDRTDLAPRLGGWIAQAGAELLADADALVPVPLHWRRQWARRFNQAAALARTVSEISGVPVIDDALGRIRATRQQVGLTQAERAANIQGAFAVSPAGKAAIRGKRLILVDDVLTSGATVDTCARVLLRSGALNVDVLVFARVVQAVRSPI